MINLNIPLRKHLAEYLTLKENKFRKCCPNKTKNYSLRLSPFSKLTN